MYSVPVEDLEDIYLRLKSIWPKNKNFLITGGTGFLGRWFVEAICYIEKKTNSQNKYIILTRQNKHDLIAKIKVLAEPFFKILQQDLQNQFKIDETIDYVIHAASDVSKIKNSKESDFSSIVTATQNLIQAVQIVPDGKFLYISSGGVYNHSENGSKEENLKLVKNLKIDSYSEAKRQSEMLVNDLKNSCSARCFSFLGPFVDPKMAVMDMMSQKIQNQSIIVNSPKVIRSFMYPSDLVVSLFKLLLLKNNSQVYNIGSDQPISLLELAKKISLIENNSEVLCKNNTESASLAGQCYYANIDRYSAEYGKMLTVDLNQALDKTFSFVNKKGKP